MCVIILIMIDVLLVVTSANALDVQTSHTIVSGEGLGSLTLFYLN